MRGCSMAEEKSEKVPEKVERPDLIVNAIDIHLAWTLWGGDTIRCNAVLTDGTENARYVARLFKIGEVSDRGVQVDMPRPDVDVDLQRGADLHVQQAELAAVVKHLDKMRR